MVIKFVDMEIIRLVMRACNHQIAKTQKVIAACKGLTERDSEVDEALKSVQATVEDMEGSPISMDDLVERIGVAEPKDPATF